MSAYSSTSSTSVSAPTRRAPGSTIQPRAYSSVSTRSMARTAAGTLTQTTLNVSSFRNGNGNGRQSLTEKPTRTLSGGKRKSSESDEEGRKRKVVRYSEEATKVETTTPPGSPNRPITPIRAVQPLVIPTPAREILRVGYDSGIKEEEEEEKGFIVKPPTPPRMKPRPPLSVPPSTTTGTAKSNPLVTPTTPGKRCLSPDQVEHRSAKRTELPTNIPTTPIRSTAQEDVSMFSVSKPIIAPIRTTVASPRRALASISRLQTPHRPTGELKPTTPGMARMTPTVPIPFSFTTPRALSAAHIDTIRPAIDAEPQVASTLTEDVSATSEPSKDVRPLPKRAVMAPPSKIPVRAAKTSLPPLSTSTAAAGSSKPKPALGVAERRPVRRTTSGQGPSKTLAVFNENLEPSAEVAPVRRKPSYPSSLGSGPLAQPRPRLISGPIQVPRSFTAPFNSSTSDKMDVDERPTMRSVSDPVPRPRSSLASSTSRREGFSADTNKSLAGLSDALAKLKVRRDATSANTTANAKAGPSTLLKPKAPTILAEVPDHINANNANTNLNLNASISSSRMSSVHRPRSSIVGADVSMMEDGDRSIAALMTSSTGSTALKGVVAFVDVRTEDGACSGDLWSDMLRGLGAKVSYMTHAQIKLISRSMSDSLPPLHISSSNPACNRHWHGTAAKIRRRNHM
jgi:hypothetical protein